MHIRCPNCGTGYQVPDEKIPEEGLKVRCTKCKHVFEVKKTEVVKDLEELKQPEARPAPPPPPLTEPTQPLYTPDLDDIPQRFKRRRTVNTVLGILIIAAVAAAAAFLIWQFGIKGAVPKTPPVDVEALYQEAYGLFKKDTLDKYMEATEVLRRILGANPKFAKAYALLSMCQLHESEMKRDSTMFEQAQLNAQKALDLGRNQADAHLAYAAIYVMRDVYDEAEKELAVAEGIDPENPLLYLIRGQLLLKQGKQDEALASFDEAIKRDPELVKALYYSAVILKDKGNYEDALMRINRLLAASPSHYEAIKLKGELQTLASQKPKESEKKEAEEKPKEEKKPEVDEFVVNLKKAKALFDRGRSSAALKFARRAVNLKPNSCQARTILGWIYLDIGDIEAAKEQFNAASGLVGCSEALYGLGVAYKEQGRKQTAIMYIQRFLDTNPSGELAQEAEGLLQTLRSAP